MLTWSRVCIILRKPSCSKLMRQQHSDLLGMLVSFCMDLFTCVRVPSSLYPSFSLISLSLYLSIYLSIYLSTWLSIYLPINLSINLSIYQSINQSINQSIYLSICKSKTKKPRKMHLCRSSSNVPRLPWFLEMRQSPHVFAHS